MRIFPLLRDLLAGSSLDRDKPAVLATRDRTGCNLGDGVLNCSTATSCLANVALANVHLAEGTTAILIAGLILLFWPTPSWI